MYVYLYVSVAGSHQQKTRDIQLSALLCNDEAGRNEKTLAGLSALSAASLMTERQRPSLHCRHSAK